MSFLEDLRKQPRLHREIMFGLCVVTTISLVGMVWYNSFEKNLYVLMNPEEVSNQKNLAENTNLPSLMGDIGKTGQDLKATFYSIFNFNSEDKNENVIERTNANGSGKVYLLPSSGSK